MVLTGAASLARTGVIATQAVSDNVASDLLIVCMTVYLSLQSAAPAKDYWNCEEVSTAASPSRMIFPEVRIAKLLIGAPKVLSEVLNICFTDIKEKVPRGTRRRFI